MPLAVDLGVDDVEDVLRHVYHLEGENRGKEFDILCPSPGHDDSRASCGVNLSNGLWNCFSCGVSGDLAGLGVLVLDLPRDAVEDLLKPNSAESLLSMVQRRLQSVPMPKVQRKTRAEVMPGPYEEPTGTPVIQELCAERGFSPETLDKWGIRFVPEQRLQGHKGEFTITNSVGIPIRDESGRVVNWCYRATRESGSWQPRYLYHSPGVNELWFGLQHNYRVQHIAITEGALDAMWVDQAGFPALALLGTKMGERKIRSLGRYKTVTLFCDRDNSGAGAVRRIGEHLGASVPLYIAQYDRRINPGKKCDPQDLAMVDVEIAMARRVSWSQFLLRQAS